MAVGGGQPVRATGASSIRGSQAAIRETDGAHIVYRIRPRRTSARGETKKSRASALGTCTRDAAADRRPAPRAAHRLAVAATLRHATGRGAALAIVGWLWTTIASPASWRYVGFAPGTGLWAWRCKGRLPVGAQREFNAVLGLSSPDRWVESPCQCWAGLGSCGNRRDRTAEAMRCLTGGTAGSGSSHARSPEDGRRKAPGSVDPCRARS